MDSTEYRVLRYLTLRSGKQEDYLVHRKFFNKIELSDFLVFYPPLFFAGHYL